jgi:CHAT domain-containing protein
MRKTTLADNHPDIADGFKSLAAIYSRLGQTAQVLRYLKNAQEILEIALPLNHARIGQVLNDIALVHLDAGQLDLAQSEFERALAIYEKSLPANHPEVATVIGNLSMLHSARGQHTLALSGSRRALAMYEATLPIGHPSAIRALGNIGWTEVMTNQNDAAARTLFRTMGLLSESSSPNPETLSRAQTSLSILYRKIDLPDLSILWGKEAINTVQNMRADISGLDKGLQASFLQGKKYIYTDLADLLISEGRLAEAQTVLQMLKEQELRDSLERAAKTDPRTTRIEPTDQERQRFAEYDKLRQQQLALGQERELLERKKQLGTISPDEQRRLEEIKTRLLPPLRDGTMLFLEALQKNAAQLARQEKRSTESSVRQAETNLQKAMQQVRQGDPQAAVAALQYVVTDSRLSILLSAPGTAPMARQIDLGAKELRQKVMAAREIVSRPPSSRSKDNDAEFLNKPLRELYALLIAPVEADLKKLSATTLVLVPNDVLRYVPFAALMNGDRYLVKDYTLALFNEAAKKDFAARVGGKSHLAAMGLTRSVPEAKLLALPAVRKEVEAVALRSGLRGKVFLDDDFTRPALMGVLGADFNMLHLASHFEFKPGRPDASRLFLGDRSTLTLGDIARDNVRFDRFSLVTFSACETGLGDTELADGRDMESLGALVQNQGAQAVIATLWKAEDQSAASLMEAFYRSRGAEKLGTAQALRAAQLKLIGSGATGNARSHPYFWAPFVLMGDWR